MSRFISKRLASFSECKRWRATINCEHTHTYSLDSMQSHVTAHLSSSCWFPLRHTLVLIVWHLATVTILFLEGLFNADTGAHYIIRIMRMANAFQLSTSLRRNTVDCVQRVHTQYANSALFIFVQQIYVFLI